MTWNDDDLAAYYSNNTWYFCFFRECLKQNETFVSSISHHIGFPFSVCYDCQKRPFCFVE